MPFASLICLAIAQGTGSSNQGDLPDDPTAVALANRMVSTYATVRSLRFQMNGGSNPDRVRAEIVFKRGRGALIRRWGPNGALTAEYRVVGPQITVWEPSSRARDLPGPWEGPSTLAFTSVAIMARLDRSYFPYWFENSRANRDKNPLGTRVRLTLGPSSHASDGTPVDTLIAEDRTTPTSFRQHVLHIEQSRFQIGVGDSLIRASEWRSDRAAPAPKIRWEYRDIRRNIEIDDSIFGAMSRRGLEKLGRPGTLPTAQRCLRI